MGERSQPGYGHRFLPPPKEHEMSDAARDADAILAEEQRVGDSRLEAAAGSELQHYMESTSRLRAENEELREQLRQAEERASDADADWHACMDRYAEAVGATQKRWDEIASFKATMREVAEELRLHSKRGVILYQVGRALADRLDPPPKEHKDE